MWDTSNSKSSERLHNFFFLDSYTLSHKELIKNNWKKLYLDTGPKNPKFRNIGRQHVADVLNVNILSET